jgi:hypothetical protein
VKDFIVLLSYDDLKLELFYRTLEFLGLYLPPRYVSSFEFHKDKIELQCAESQQTVERLFTLLRDLHYFDSFQNIATEDSLYRLTDSQTTPKITQSMWKYDWWCEVMNMNIINDPKKQAFIRSPFNTMILFHFSLSLSLSIWHFILFICH